MRALPGKRAATCVRFLAGDRQVAPSPRVRGEGWGEGPPPPELPPPPEKPPDDELPDDQLDPDELPELIVKPPIVAVPFDFRSFLALTYQPLRLTTSLAIGYPTM